MSVSTIWTWLPQFNVRCNVVRVAMALGFFSMAYTTTSRLVFLAACNVQKMSGPRPAPTRVTIMRFSSGMEDDCGTPCLVDDGDGDGDDDDDDDDDEGRRSPEGE